MDLLDTLKKINNLSDALRDVRIELHGANRRHTDLMNEAQAEFEKGVSEIRNGAPPDSDWGRRKNGFEKLTDDLAAVNYRSTQTIDASVILQRVN